jgi:hypothetical protein
VDANARIVGDAPRQRRAFVADEINRDSRRSERLRVVLHAGAASEIGQRDDDGSHE